MLSRYLLKERLYGPWKITKGLPSLWFHGASLGECKVLVNLVHRLVNEKVLDNSCILITTQKAEIISVLKRMVESLQNVEIAIAPAPFSFSMKNFCKSVNPAGLVLCENELWPAYLKEVKNIALVSGRFKNAAPWAKLNALNFATFQTNGDLVRFLKKACINKNAYSVSGNWKLLAKDAQKIPGTSQEKTKKYDVAFLSVHFSEWSAIKNLVENSAKLGQRILLAPRRLEEISLFDSELKKIKAEKSIEVVRVFGILQSMLPLCKVAVIGGSFVEKPGIHNFLEPLEMGIPTFVGPYANGENEFVECLLEKRILTRIAAGVQTLPMPLENSERITTFVAEEKKTVELGYAALVAELKKWKLR